MRRHTWALAALLIVLPSGSALALDPAKRITQYPQAVWTADDGLAQNNAHAVAQDAEGYLWVGTESGLSRFDGLDFTPFLSSNTEGILNNSVWVISVSRSGDLFVGTEGGLVHRTPKRFRTYTAADGLPASLVYALCEDAQGVLWVGTANGLARFADGAFTRVTDPEALGSDRIRSLLAARDGSLWVGTDTRGLFRLKDGRWTAYTTRDGLPVDRIWVVREDREGAIWAGTYGGGLARYRDGDFRTFTPADGLANRFVYAIVEDRDGNLWVGTDRGLSRRRGEGFETARREDGLAHDKVWCLHEDREGNLWIVTRGGGLLRLTDARFTTYGRRQGLLGENIFSISEAPDGAVWGATLGSGGGVVRLRDGEATAFTDRDGLVQADRMWTVLADSRGDVWAGGDAGLFRLVAGRFRPEQDVRDVRALYEDSRGRLWVGTFGHGLACLDDGRLTTYTSKDGLPHDSVVALREAPGGALWVGTWGGGLARFEGGAFEPLTTAQGLVSDSVRALYGDAQGTLWVGTTGGLSRLRDGRFTGYTMKQGLDDDLIFQIFEDGRGSFWFGSTRGVFQVPREDLEAVARGTLARVRTTVYGTADGLAVSSCTGASTPSGWKGRDGRLWFPTQAGMAVVDPAKPLTNTVPPPVVVEQVVVGGHAQPADGTIAAPYGMRDIQIRYTALSLRAPAKLRFRYQLAPFDADWIDAGPRRTAFYTNLPPGRYRFRVAAAGEPGRWNQSDGDLELVLPPFFYQTTWFLAVCALATAGVGPTIYALRVRSLKRRERQLQVRVEEALGEVKVLSGLLPICASCKKIRDDGGHWNQMEVYIRDRTEADFSHSLCPDCAARLYPGIRLGGAKP